MSKYGDFSGPYFPVFGLNTGKYRNIRARKNSVFRHFLSSVCVKSVCVGVYFYTKLKTTFLSTQQNFPEKLSREHLWSAATDNHRFASSVGPLFDWNWLKFWLWHWKFNPHIHKIFLWGNCMKLVSGDPWKEIIN